MEALGQGIFSYTPQKEEQVKKTEGNPFFSEIILGSPKKSARQGVPTRTIQSPKQAVASQNTSSAERIKRLPVVLEFVEKISQNSQPHSVPELSSKLLFSTVEEEEFQPTPSLPRPDFSPEGSNERSINAVDFFGLAEEEEETSPQSVLNFFELPEERLSTKALLFCESPKRKAPASRISTSFVRKTRRLSPGSRQQGKPRICRPQILDNSLFILNGKTYAVQLITRSNKENFHRIYEFISDENLDLNGTNIPAAQVILRAPISNLDDRKIDELIIEGIQAYQNLKHHNVPLPVCYVEPRKFTDSVDPKNGDFWIIEKMSEQVTVTGWQGNSLTFKDLSAKDQKVLAFVHHWLHKSFIQQEDLIPDFFPRNVMFDFNGKLKIVDFATTKNNWLNNLQNYIIGWAAGNTAIQKYLESALNDV